jgi:hypothetical protein
MIKDKDWLSGDIAEYLTPLTYLKEVRVAGDEERAIVNSTPHGAGWSGRSRHACRMRSTT